MDEKKCGVRGSDIENHHRPPSVFCLLHQEAVQGDGLDVNDQRVSCGVEPLAPGNGLQCETVSGWDYRQCLSTQKEEPGRHRGVKTQGGVRPTHFTRKE